MTGSKLKNENTNYVSYLIDLAKSGRQRAFIELAEINLKNVFTVSYRLLADYESAKKVTYKTFAYSWEHIKSFDKTISFPVWIKSLSIQFSIEELSQRLSDLRLPLETVGDLNEIEYLEYLIISLPITDRIIFVLHDLEGFSYREINAYFDDMIVDEVKTRLLGTRHYLMEKLGL